MIAFLKDAAHEALPVALYLSNGSYVQGRVELFDVAKGLEDPRYSEQIVRLHGPGGRQPGVSEDRTGAAPVIVAVAHIVYAHYIED